MRKNKKMVTIYRRSSPRTGKQYDSRLILAKNMDQHIRAGWKTEITDEEESSDLIPPSMLNDEQIAEIRNAKGTQRQLAELYHVSAFTVHRIKAGKI